MALPATFSKEKNVTVCVATMYCRFLTEILERSQVKILKIAAIVYVGFVCVWVIYLPRLYMQNYDAKTNFLMILHMVPFAHDDIANETVGMEFFSTSSPVTLCALTGGEYNFFLSSGDRKYTLVM